MKLKPIVASLMLLGLAAPAFADDSATQAQLDQMKAQMNKMQAIINQNGSAAYQLPQPADWMSRITISGLLNVDGAYANRSPVTYRTNGSVSDLYINNVNLLMDAAVNDWTSLHLNLMDRSNTSATLTPAYSHGDDTLHADEAYVTIGNFAQSPVYFRAGTEYVPFGVYDLYPMVVNPTQALSQSRDTAAQVGFVSPMGLYGAAYGFRGVDHQSTTGNRATIGNYGVNLGWAQCTDAFGVKLDAGYIANMADVDYIAQGTTFNDGYASKTPGLSLHAGINVAAFDFKGDYVEALKAFNTSDVVSDNGTSGAKPRAWGLEAGYSFPVMNNHTSRVAVGYQQTRQANDVGPAVSTTLAAGLPKNRWYGMYNVNVSKWTDVGFEVYRDKDYTTTSYPTSGTTGRNATVGMIRLGVKFA